MGLNMRPIPPLDYSVDRLQCHAVLVGEGLLKNCAGFVSSTNCHHVSGGKFCAIVLLAFNAVVVRFAALANHVGVIIGGRSSKKMFWIAAFGIVALMASEQPVRHESESQLIGDSVGAKAAIVFGSRHTVAGVVDVTEPVPAIIWTAFVHSQPESLWIVGHRFAMTLAESRWLSAHAALAQVGGRGQWSLATTSTLTLADWDRIIHAELSARGFGRAAGCYKHRSGIFVNIIISQEAV